MNAPEIDTMAILVGSVRLLVVLRASQQTAGVLISSGHVVLSCVS